MKISDQAKALIESKTLALGTSGPMGVNVTPVSSCKVVDDKVIITDNYLGSTRENIIDSSKLTIAVWDESTKGKEYGFKLFGKAEYFNKGRWFDYVKNMEENKGFPCKGAVVFSPGKIIKI